MGEQSQSWPAGSGSAEIAAANSETVRMKVDPRWPFNMLRIRQHASSTDMEAVTTEDVVAILPREAMDGFVFQIDVTNSSHDFWKVAAATAKDLADAGYARRLFSADREGFIVKSYEGRNTLVRI